MKLALLYHQFIRRGGLEGYLLEFSRRLAEAGHELHLVTVTGRIEPDYAALARSVHLTRKKLTGTATLANFAEESARIAPALGCDAVLGFGRTWAQDIHRAGGGCHRVYSGMLPWYKRWKRKNRLELELENRLYTGDRTRLFVVNSQKVAAEITALYGVDPARIHVIETAVDSMRYAPAPDAERATLRRTHALDPERPVLLFVSLDHRRKGLGDLLDALERVPGPELWIAGAPIGSFAARLESPGLRGRVKVFPKLDDLRPLYCAADWFVHPSRYDACANTVLQSMACGLPGIISDGDGAAMFVRPGENGYIVSASSMEDRLPALLQTALSRSAEDRRAMSLAARATMEPLTWQHHLDKWLALIGSLASAARTETI